MTSHSHPFEGGRKEALLGSNLSINHLSCACGSGCAFVFLLQGTGEAKGSQALAARSPQCSLCGGWGGSAGWEAALTDDFQR